MKFDSIPRKQRMVRTTSSFDKLGKEVWERSQYMRKSKTPEAPSYGILYPINEAEKFSAEEQSLYWSCVRICCFIFKNIQFKKM